MTPEQFIGPAEAAARLGISAKALRLYEQRGLVRPSRSEAGWRAYGPAEMAKLGEIMALRSLGLSLKQVERILRGDAADLEAALGTHQEALKSELALLARSMEAVQAIRDGIAEGNSLPVSELMKLTRPDDEIVAAFRLPWPWGGEWFELRGRRAVTYIVGPLASGKTKLAMRLAEELPNAAFTGLDRNVEAARMAIAADSVMAERVKVALEWIEDEGGEASDALLTVLAAMLTTDRAAVVVDMVEEGLDQPTQQALGAFLRRPGFVGPNLYLMTRSSALLDLESLDPRDRIILCPANHQPPSVVFARPGAAGYETVASCLGTPEARARTAGVVAMRRS
jgi:DNA-binding transcriptional MerR regulator